MVSPRFVCAALAVFITCTLTSSKDTHAATGDILRQFVVPVGSGGGRGAAFDGTNLYYTMDGRYAIYKISTTGALLATIPTTDLTCGGPLAWDGQYLWTTGYSGCADAMLYQLDPVDGSIISQCDVTGAAAARQPDGLDWQNSQLVLSAEALAPTWVSHLSEAGVVQSEFHATDRNYPGFGQPVGPAGVSFDGPCHLWHAYPQPFGSLLVQTDLAGVETGSTVGVNLPGAAIEDLALDTVTFSPKTVLWGMSTGKTMYAVEVPGPDPCLPTPARSTSWGAVKTLWR